MHKICIRFDYLDFIDTHPKDIMSYIIEHYAPQKFCWSEEVSKETSKLHYHGYVCIDSDKKLDSTMRSIRRYLKSIGYSAHLFCVQKLKRTEIMYLTYMCKDGKVLENNLSDNEKDKIEYNITQFKE